MTSQSRRSSIDAASVQSILSPAIQQQAADPPSPHIGSSPSRAHFSMPPPPRPPLGHSRTRSYAPRRPNRLSLSFPIATGLAPYTADPSRPTPTSSTTQSFPPTPADILTSPTDPTGFLVALASQERKVLELKDELQKAEVELKRLKRQWMSREATKKDAEIKNVERLQPLPLRSVVVEGNTEEGGVTNRHSMEIDKRKLLLNNLNIPKDKDKDGRRKFSGAHTRTLSLLSPERSGYTQPFPFPPVQETSEANSPSRSTAIPDTSIGITKISSNRKRHSYQSGVTHNAKLIAEDLKAGLWTFMEDIRQATIGDEATGTSGKPIPDPVKSAVKKSSKSSLRSNDKRRGHSPRDSPHLRQQDFGAGESSLFDAAEPLADKSRPRPKTSLSKQKISRPLSLAAPAIDDLDDGWSNWDSPLPKSPRWSGSTTTTDTPTTPLNGGSDERAVKIRDEDEDAIETPCKAPREDIQWPSLEKLTPGNLKRTMSTIMQEWEKSLSPRADVQASPLSHASSSAGEDRTEGDSKEAAEERRRSVQDDLILMSR